MTPDEKVRAWYSDHWGPTVHSCKKIDWELAPMELLYEKDVLNVGPDYPVDELYLGYWAKSWTAVDFTPAVVDKLQRLEPVLRGLTNRPFRFVLGDMRELPFPDQSFDVVLDFSASDHVQEGRSRAYRGFARVLRPGGHLVLTYANWLHEPTLPQDTEGEYGFVHRFTPEEVEGEMRGAGLAILEHRTGSPRSGILCRKEPTCRS